MSRVRSTSPEDSRSGSSDLPAGHAKASFWTLMLGSVGVVYGDIGTSPLYALKESLSLPRRAGRSPARWCSVWCRW